MEKIGLGGSCHWCTEAIFQSIIGVSAVKQGWIRSVLPNDGYSEAVLISFDEQKVGLDVLIQIHLHSHSCTANHSMRIKYRSAVYYFNNQQSNDALKILNNLQKDFDHPVITQVLPFIDFKINDIDSLNYYYSNPEKPFCQTYIEPKLKKLMDKFSERMNIEKLKKSNPFSADTFLKGKS